jgi:restriction system protein
MTRRRRRKKEVDLIEGLAGLALVGSFLLGFKVTGSVVGAAVITGCVLGLIIGVLIVIRMQREEKLKKSGIRDIDKMDGIQFEHYLKLLFSSKGYKVEVTRASGDYGADLVLRKDNKKIVVQAKRHTKNVGVSAIQEVVGSKAHYKADEAWVITNSDFTEAAVNLAQSNGVRLINREQLIEMILQMNPAAVPNPQKIITELKTGKKICDRCGREMVLRKGPKGQFYGCSGFPRCRNIKAVE